MSTLMTTIFTFCSKDTPGRYSIGLKILSCSFLKHARAHVQWQCVLTAILPYFTDPDTVVASNRLHIKFFAIVFSNSFGSLAQEICKWYNLATSWENLFMPYANNKGADQPAHPRGLISAFVVRCLDSIIPLLATSGRIFVLHAPVLSELAGIEFFNSLR